MRASAFRNPPATTGRHRRIGILGGSFNPAHAGHLHISRHALDRLRLDEVWWLVSPQNPLKPIDGMATFEDRMNGARVLTQGSKIRVSDLEREIGTQYTADTLKALKGRFPRCRFVWIMGADNLIEINHWNKWTAIFETVPVAVLARPDYSFKALVSTAAKRFQRYRIKEIRASALADSKPPAWVFLEIPLSAASATLIRSGR